MKWYLQSSTLLFPPSRRCIMLKSEKSDSVSLRSASIKLQSKVPSFLDSFRRLEPRKATDLEASLSDDSVRLALPLESSLKDRHVQMIAIAGCVGTGLFISLGTALAQAGPAGLVISYTVVSVLLFFIVQSLGQLSAAFPALGNFLAYNTRFIDESWGFAMNWNYCLQWIVTLPLSLVSASKTIQFWDSDINTVVWVAIFYVVICGINLFGVRGYGEAEFIFSLIKVVAIVGFCIMAVVFICGGSPNHIGYIGAKYWHHPGPFATGFKGVCSVFVNAAFLFAGTELCALAAANAANPRSALPKAVKQVFWRILIFYMLSTMMVCFLVPYNHPDLMSTDTKSALSPFIVAIQSSGVKALPSIFNVVIILAVLSVANAAVFASTRPLVALAEAGHGPLCLKYIDRKGRPLFALLFTYAIGLLCFVCVSPKQDDVFNWLLALSGLLAIFTWISIAIAMLRVTHACKVQGVLIEEEFPFIAKGGVYGAWLTLVINALILIAQFYVGLYPVDGKELDISTFLQVYLAAPVVLVCYVGHKIWTRNWKLYVKACDMDITSGRRIVDLDVLRQQRYEEKLEWQSRPWYYRLFHTWC